MQLVHHWEHMRLRTRLEEFAHQESNLEVHELFRGLEEHEDVEGEFLPDLGLARVKKL